MIELQPGHNYEVALRDLQEFDRIWLLWWFHKNDNWRPTTLPPRGRTGRKGVFSTRSPYRPNPIAMSCVQLLTIDGLNLHIGPHDLLDQTPILDIKPYMPKFDSFPESRAGWFDEMERALEESPSYQVDFNEESLTVLENDPDLRDTIEGLLASDPMPHRTRRIMEYQGGYRLSCGDWRVLFEIESRSVRVKKIFLRE